MGYYLIAIDLETTENSVKYKRPKWYEDKKLSKKEKNLSNTTPADKFVDLMIETDDEKEIDELIKNGAIEQTAEQFSEWVRVKNEILKAQMIKEEIDVT